jgi:TetR/AcrR family transcriptional repressor of lmrAB and yxaGH operons
MLLAARTLFAEKGYLSTTLDDVVAASGTPRGSVYFHFPGGKEQIALETARAVSVSMPNLVREMSAAAGSPADLVRRFFHHHAEIFQHSQHRQGCPIAATTLETMAPTPLLGELNTAFHQWREAFVAPLRAAGCTEVEAGAAAALILSSFEGALIQARAAQDGGIITTVGTELASYIAHKLGNHPAEWPTNDR